MERAGFAAEVAKVSAAAAAAVWKSAFLVVAARVPAVPVAAVSADRFVDS